MTSEPEALNQRMIKALEKYMASFSPEVLQPFAEEQRYGYKGIVRIALGAEAYDLTALAILPEHGTGQADPRLRIPKVHRFPRNHDDNSHEWVISLEDKPNIDLHTLVLSPRFDILTTLEFFEERAFTSHRTLYMTRDELFANPLNPRNLVVRVGDVHALYNATDATQLLLVHAAKKGVPLNLFQEKLIENTGGVDSYLLALDESTHEPEPKKDPYDFGV